MTILFWVLVGLITWSYAGYPLLILTVAGIAGRRRRARDDEHAPRVSLIIPAYNEARVIGEKLANILDHENPPEPLEVLLESDSDHQTDSHVDRHPPHADIHIPSTNRLG